MNITFLSQVYRPTVNGVVISIDNFARGLREFGHTVNIVAMKSDAPYKDDEFTFRWRYSKKKKGADYGLYWPFSKEIGEIFKKSDIIHVQHPFYESLVSMPQKWFRGKRVVFTYHTMYDEYSESYIPWLGLGKTKAIKGIVRRLVLGFCNKCDLVVVPSTGAKDFLKGKKVKTKIEVIPTGIDVDRFAKADGSDLMEEYGIEGPLIIYTGRVAKEKNIDMLLEAYKRVSETHDVTLMLVGAADKELEAKAKDISGVVLTGKIKPEEMPKYYNIPGTLFFVTPSYTETQGITFLEAMAAGLPVIAMGCWGSGDFVKNRKNGYIIHSLEELVSRMVQLLENTRLQKKMRRNAAEFAKEFTILNQAGKMQQAYLSILPGA